jgi:hypothetical protein
VVRPAIAHKSIRIDNQRPYGVAFLVKLQSMKQIFSSRSIMAYIARERGLSDSNDLYGRSPTMTVHIPI